MQITATYISLIHLALLISIIIIAIVVISIYRHRKRLAEEAAERRWQVAYERQQAEDAERRRRTASLHVEPPDVLSPELAEYEYKTNPDGSFTKVKKRR